MNERSEFDLARRLRQEGATLGELFSFMSSLYFRGKWAYARAFANCPISLAGAYVVTAAAGLVLPETRVTLSQIHEMCAGDVDPANLQYRVPLDRDVQKLSEMATDDCQFILLGSIATMKYAEPLLEILGERLFFPAEFIGRGDMSRGGLLLRCVNAGIELTYVPVEKAVRRGPRPPKLQRLARSERPSFLPTPRS